MHDVAVRIHRRVSEYRVHLVEIRFAQHIEPYPAPGQRRAGGKDRRRHGFRVTMPPPRSWQHRKNTMIYLPQPSPLRTHGGMTGRVGTPRRWMFMQAGRPDHRAKRGPPTPEAYFPAREYPPFWTRLLDAHDRDWPRIIWHSAFAWALSLGYDLRNEDRVDRVTVHASAVTQTPAKATALEELGLLLGKSPRYGGRVGSHAVCAARWPMRG